MRVVSFLHQKGGTGKSTLAIGLATSLAARGDRVLLLDTDYQGTSGDWGNRFGSALGVEVRSQVQPIVHREISRFASLADWLVIDGPPGLSEMTQSIVQAGGRMIVPLRPALPDLWALPWLVAVIGRARQAAAREGRSADIARLVINQYRGEDLAAIRRDLGEWAIPVHDEPIPDDPSFPLLFRGERLPGRLQEQLMRLANDVLEPGSG